MRRFLALMEGSDPAAARTILATEDSQIVEAFVRDVTERLYGSDRPAPTWEPDAERFDLEQEREL
ncbi:hypothetical protein ACFL3S_09500 [Gemmatimonadota bacterium]